MQNLLPKKSILDFGCGAGGFLKICHNFGIEADGVEPEIRVIKYWDKVINIYPDIKFSKKNMRESSNI